MEGVLPGEPRPYVLRRGEGEHAMFFGDLFTVLLPGDETKGQFGIVISESPAGETIPTHSHNATHETFAVLEGAVRLFYEDAEGTRAPSCTPTPMPTTCGSARPTRPGTPWPVRSPSCSGT